MAMLFKSPLSVTCGNTEAPKKERERGEGFQVSWGSYSQRITTGKMTFIQDV